ncbi:hypothetical protein [Gordonia sp. SL306]|uniref:hypothetical protein n=1 Tax=Gordonia sp. SL306 TaxID=2995145 RepID=UPI002270AEF5|nr:hypothetical protein [Gordonia sp. SL306]WAC53832.1 hypothetical protein OVA31_14055 [Gordonia sp. SL306]
MADRRMAGERTLGEKLCPIGEKLRTIGEKAEGRPPTWGDRPSVVKLSCALGF